MLRRKGFTLIELVVAMAILLVFIGIAFGTLSRYFVARSANEQGMILQQNFRTAMDRMRYDFAQAGSTNPISSPTSNAVSNVLTFVGADRTTTISYSLGANTSAGTYCVQRTTVNGTSQPVTEPVTEDMHQLVNLFFVRSGGKIVVIIVGHLKYFGSDRPVSFASMIVSRNANYAQSPSS
ncbi:MAG TPA: type II secretion system protein [Candidatus Cryosericum sp.]